MELLLIIGILALDQLTKYWTELYIPFGTSVPLIDGVFQLSNVHNTGAAWGMLAGKQWLFLAITPVFCFALAWFLVKNRNRLGAWGRICIALLIAGACGNLIDRIALTYVRDMLDFCLIDFPVFNVADCSICVGAGMLIVDTLFMKERSIFEVLEKKKPREDGEANGDA